MKTHSKINFYPITPGILIPGDWFPHPIPRNIKVGNNSVLDTAAIFKQFFSTLPIGLSIGNNVTLASSTIATEENAMISIGDYCYIAKASIAATKKISIGNFVFIAGGVNIVDSDFHPVDPASRLADTIALSPVGNKSNRPSFQSKEVTIEDEVWIGFNSTILKGVHIGKGAIIQPGTVVFKDIPEGKIVSGNPGTIIGEI